MARIKVELPEVFKFSCKIPIRITDVNYGGHVGNDSILSIMHEARLQFLAHYGFSETKIADNVGLIMSGVTIEYKREAFYGDIVEVSVTAAELEKVSFELFYQLETYRENKLLRVANAQSTMICFNYQTRRVASIPEELREKLG